MTASEGFRGVPDVSLGVGDLVRVGSGRKIWRIASFWGEGFARLEPVEGYSATSVRVESLKPAPGGVS